MSATNKTVQEKISSTSTVQCIADISPFLNKESIDHKKLAEANTILDSGSCTSIRLSYNKNLILNAPNGFPEHSLCVAANEIITVFFKTIVQLIHSKALEHLETIEIADLNELISDEFYQAIALLPQLHTIRIERAQHFQSKQFFTLLSNPSIKNVSIMAILFGRDIDSKKLHEMMAISQIKDLSLYNCHVTDSMLEAISTSKTLKKLDLSHNHQFSSKGLQALAYNSGIIDLTLGSTAHDSEGTLTLIRANQLQSLNDPIGEYTQKFTNEGHFAYEGRLLTSKEFELIDQAFEENTSILRAGIVMRHQIWPSQYPCRAFRAPINEAERLLSIPIEDSRIYWTRFFDSYTYTPRNLALKAACESTEVFKEISTNIMTVLLNYLAGAKQLAPIITSYAQPNGKELINVFSVESAERLFPNQLPILRQFGLYKQSGTAEKDHHSKGNNNSYTLKV